MLINTKSYFIKIFKGLTNPRILLLLIINKVSPLIKNDKSFIKIKWRLTMPYPLDLDNPQTFNEKQQWLKLYDRRPIYTLFVDKYLVKEYVAKIIGEEHIIPTIGVWDNPEDIDFSLLPQQFVLKCNHNSGQGMFICKDKNTMDKRKVVAELKKGLSHNYYLWGREWPYKNVSRKIIAEKYMEDNGTNDLRDYKFFCFNGKVKFFKVDFDRFVNHHANYYSKYGELLPFGEVVCPPLLDRILKLPSQLETMVVFAERLSQNIPFLRVDFYEVNNMVYFGELTLFPNGGFGRWTDDKVDYEFGKWISLPINTTI